MRTDFSVYTVAVHGIFSHKASISCIHIAHAQLIPAYPSKDAGQSASVQENGTGTFFCGILWDGWQVWFH